MEKNKIDWRLPTIEEQVQVEDYEDSEYDDDLPQETFKPAEPEMEEWERIGLAQEAAESSSRSLIKRERGVLTVRQLTAAKKKKLYLERLAATGQKTKACVYAGWTSLATVRAIAKKDPNFAAAEQEAIEAAADHLESEAMRRSAEGVEKPIFQKGKLQALVREFSDPLTMFLLRGLRPDRYRDRSRVDHDVNVKVTGVAILPASMINAVTWEQQAQAVHANQKLIDITPIVIEEKIITKKVDTPDKAKQTTLERA